MSGEALRTVKLRNDFYRDNFRRMVWILLVSILLNVGLIVVLLFMTTHRPQPVYFATSNDGRLVRLQPRTDPVMNNTAVLSWVSRSVPAIYRLDFLNYRSQLNAVRKYFTPYGWKQFVNAFAPTIERIKKQHLVASAAPAGVPVIMREGIVNGVFSWQVQIPLVVSFQKGSTEQVQHVVWTLILQRVNNTQSDQLLGISQVVQTVQQSGS